MRTTRILLLALVFTAFALNSAVAATYQLSVPQLQGRSYMPGDSLSALVDFGLTFSSISSASIQWSGNVWPGVEWMWNGIGYDPYPIFGEVRTVFEWGDGDVGAAKDSYAGGFDETSTSSGGTYEGLLDGKANVNVTFNGDMPSGSGPGGGNPAGGWIDEYYVIVEGTPSPVPEPSSLLALGSGILGLVGIIRRRNR
jgi:hypothetical protein